MKAQLEELPVVKNVPAVENEGRFSHRFIYPFEVQCPEKIPLRYHGDSIAAAGRVVGIVEEGDQAVCILEVLSCIGKRLRVGNVHSRLFFNESLCNRNGRAFPGVPRIGLESESEQADPFSPPVC